MRSTQENIMQDAKENEKTTLPPNLEESSHTLGQKFKNPGEAGDKIVSAKFNSLPSGNSGKSTPLKLKGD